MIRTRKRVEDAMDALAREEPALALSIATGVFVSLILNYTRSAGHDPDCDIRVDGGTNRDITVHAPKNRAAIIPGAKP